MSFRIFNKMPTPKGRTRSKIDKMLKDEWGTTSFRNEGDKDKAGFVERKLRAEYGVSTNNVKARILSDVE